MPKPNEPVVEEAPIPEVNSERSDALLDGLFGDTPTPAPEKKKEEVVEEVVVEDEAVEDEEVVEDENEEVDYDSEIVKKKEDEVDPANETMARKQAKENGRKVKELTTQLTEKDLEIDRLKKEADDVRSRLEEVEALKVKPEDHPEYADLRSSILEDVTEAADLLSIPDTSAVRKNFGDFLADYMAMSALDGDKRSEARVALKGNIVDRLGLSDIPYAELDTDERKAYDSTVTDVLKIVQRNVGKTKELQKLHDKLSEKAKSGQLSFGVRNYENTVSEFKPVLDAVGDLADDVIEASPHSVESVVAKLVKGSPEAKKRLEKAKADVLEVIVGPRALTQPEIDKLEANGKDVKTFLAERAKSHRVKQLKFVAQFVQGLMTRSVLKESLSELAKLKGDADQEEDELEVLSKTTKKTAPKKVKEDNVRKDPLRNLFDGDWED